MAISRPHDYTSASFQKEGSPVVRFLERDLVAVYMVESLLELLFDQAAIVRPVPVGGVAAGHAVDLGGPELLHLHIQQAEMMGVDRTGDVEDLELRAKAAELALALQHAANMRPEIEVAVLRGAHKDVHRLPVVDAEPAVDRPQEQSVGVVMQAVARRAALCPRRVFVLDHVGDELVDVRMAIEDPP